LDAEFDSFKIGELIRLSRLEKGLTQSELALKVGTTKSFILKVESNIKEARISAIQSIIELGFGGKLESNIRY
jgi:transcriptional regulator with XRE-family HTH domain